MADSEKTTGTDGDGVAESGFFGRWSRRKLDRQTEPAIADPVADGEIDADSSDLSPQDQLSLTGDQLGDDSAAPPAAAEDPERLLTDDDMPPLESLNADSDYSPFFSEGVSKQLRNMALKKLFFSGKFALRDGLDDYDDDFTKFEPLGNTVTSDMKFHERRKEKARLAKLEEERLEQEQLEQEQARLEREQEELEQQANAEQDTQELPLEDPAHEVVEAKTGEEHSEPDADLAVLLTTTPDDVPIESVKPVGNPVKPTLEAPAGIAEATENDQDPQEKIHTEDEKRKLT